MSAGQSLKEQATDAERVADTFPKLLLRDYQQWGDGQIALRKKEFGIWREYTWKDCYEKTKAICLGLVSLGLGAGDAVAILGDNDREWLWCELAVQAAGGVVVGLQASGSIEETRGLMAFSRSRIKMALAQDQEQVDKLLEIMEGLPSLERIVYWHERGLRNYSDPTLMGLAELIRLGEGYDKSQPGEFERKLALGNRDDVAMILFTRGADGSPRVMPVTHRFLLSAAEAAMIVQPVHASDEYASIMSPVWFFEQVLGFGTSLLTGQRLNFPERADTGPTDSREIAPHIVMYPPRFWEVMAGGIQKNMAGGNQLKRAMYNRSLSAGYERIDRLSQGRRIGLCRVIRHRLADLLVLHPLRDKHGLNRARVVYAAGGALPQETVSFFRAIGVDIKPIFGSTKDGIVSAPPPDNIRIE
jgi:long-chain acyl-CoA synthetase